MRTTPADNWRNMDPFMSSSDTSNMLQSKYLWSEWRLQKPKSIILSSYLFTWLWYSLACTSDISNFKPCFVSEVILWEVPVISTKICWKRMLQNGKKIPMPKRSVAIDILKRKLKGRAIKPTPSELLNPSNVVLFNDGLVRKHNKRNEFKIKLLQDDNNSPPGWWRCYIQICRLNRIVLRNTIENHRKCHETEYEEPKWSICTDLWPFDVVSTELIHLPFGAVATMTFVHLQRLCEFSWIVKGMISCNEWSHLIGLSFTMIEYFLKRLDDNSHFISVIGKC